MLGLIVAAILAGAAEAPPPETVIFVCEHGTVKSVIAAELFNRRAAERKLAFRAVSRGVTPDAAVPAGVAANLGQDGFDVSRFVPAPLEATEVAKAHQVIAIGVDPPLLRDTKAHREKTERWNDIPPASTQYAAARDAMARRVESLLDALAGPHVCQ